MGIENERERTSSMMDCKHNVLYQENENKERQNIGSPPKIGSKKSVLE